MKYSLLFPCCNKSFSFILMYYLMCIIYLSVNAFLKLWMLIKFSESSISGSHSVISFFSFDFTLKSGTNSPKNPQNDCSWAGDKK